jgi:proteasome maturation protein
VLSSRLVSHTVESLLLVTFCRIERLPGLPSSKLGLESLTGDLDHFGFESYLPSMEEKTNVLEEPHAKMERKLGL